MNTLILSLPIIARVYDVFLFYTTTIISFIAMFVLILFDDRVILKSSVDDKLIYAYISN